MSFSVYVLLCKDNSFYTGSTDNINQRIKDHNNGKGAFTTRKKLPVKLIYTEEFETKREMLRREKQIKGWSRGKKEALIHGNTDKLKQLSKRKI